MFASLHTSTLAVRHVQTRGSLAKMLNRLRLGLIARQQRQHLLTLDDGRLADIGLTRTEARAEAARPIWDVPANWRN